MAVATPIVEATAALPVALPLVAATAEVTVAETVIIALGMAVVMLSTPVNINRSLTVCVRLSVAVFDSQHMRAEHPVVTRNLIALPS